MKKAIITVLSFLILSLGATGSYAFYFTEADGCYPIDLRNEFQIKMRNQGDVSWCYAHAAADYLQFLNRVPEQVSAADIATLYNQRRLPRFFKWILGGVVAQTGFIRGAIYDIASIGYCPEEFFPSENWTKRYLTGEKAGQAESVPIMQALKEFVGLVEHVKKGFFLSPMDLPFVFEFKGMSQDQFMEVLFFDQAGDALNALRSAACDSRRKPFPKNVTQVEMIWKGKGVFSRINEVLDQKQPVTVDFFYGVLENADDYSYSIADLHTTLLSGRRFDPITGECQYLIKNSYGEDCSSYDPRHQCEKGYLWLGESDLYGAMTSFVKISGLDETFSGNDPQTQDESDFR